MNIVSVILFSLAILECSLAVPPKDWPRIKHKNIYVEGLVPVGNISEIDKRVIGGREAIPNSFPYMVAVLMNGYIFCGGSLIARNFVLTAAHCIDDAVNALVILGAHRPLQIEPTQIIVTSRSFIVHPGWDMGKLIHDVALIQLPSEIPLNFAVQTVAIAPANSGSFAGATGLLTGWGYTSDYSTSVSETLQQVSLQFLSTEECMEYAGVMAHETNICTYGFNGNYNVGSCFGDSGSPIVSNGVQVGIVSFGSGQCSSGSITSYARVSSYANWINSQIRIRTT